MMRKFIFFIFFIIFVLVIVINYLEQDSPPKIKISIEGSTFKNVKFTQKKGGQINLNVYSEEIFMSEDGQFMELREINIHFPEGDFKVLAQRGSYYLRDGKLHLKEKIEANIKNLVISTEEAQWDLNNKLILSEKPIKIESKNFIIEGNAGKANQDLIELKRGVKATVYVKKRN